MDTHFNCFFSQMFASRPIGALPPEEEIFKIGFNKALFLFSQIFSKLDK